MTDDFTKEERVGDALLRSAGQDWRDQHERAGGAAMHIPLLPHRESHRGSAAQAFAAAVLVAACLGVIFAVVPHWGSPKVPAASTNNALGCQIEAFAVNIGTPAASPTGTRATVEVTYSGDEACVIPGSGPDVQLVVPDGAVLLHGGQLVTVAAHDRTVESGQVLRFDVVWSSWCGAPYHGATVRVNLNNSAPDWWATAYGQFSVGDVPHCQNGVSSISTGPLIDP